MKRIPWIKVEKEAKRRLQKDARREFDVLRRVLDLANSALALPRTSSIGVATEAQVILLSNLVNTSRAIALTAERGYLVQGLAQLAGAYELAASIGYVGKSDERAQKWKAHSNQQYSFPPADKRETAFRNLLAAGGVPQDRVAALAHVWEARHQFYCMAKHGNPELLREIGIRRSEKELGVSLGPIAGGKYSELAQLIALRAAKLCLMATAAFISREAGNSVSIPDSFAERLLAAAKTVYELENEEPGAGAV